ncbi:MAG: hypothetical protein PUG67_06145, partial [Peptoniphilaceae bacterium]|nr:hypothetical protein [Peptoniphilaceae bacterium]
IKVTPPANVDGPITVTVKDGDFDSDKVYEVPVTGHTKDKDDNGSEVTPSTLTDADVITPTLPTDKTPVADKTKLTDKEKSEIKDKIEKSNKDKFPEGTKVEVGNDGSATITYPDGSQDTIPGSDLVVEKTPEAPKTQADETNPTVPSKTEVANKDDLTQEEKDKVKKAIEDANKDKFPEGTKVEVGNDGSATITYPDGSQDIIPGSDLVVEKTPEAQSQADQITPNIPDNRTLVADKDKLTDKEKETVKTRLEKANKDNFPQGTKVEVGNDGSATITYPDGSKDTIPGSKLVVEENKATVKKVVDKKSNSPKTGVTGLAGVAGTLAAATAALFGTRKKKEDQE